VNLIHVAVEPWNDVHVEMPYGRLRVSRGSVDGGEKHSHFGG
jgi:hypothetical protein